MHTPGLGSSSWLERFPPQLMVPKLSKVPTQALVQARDEKGALPNAVRHGSSAPTALLMSVTGVLVILFYSAHM